MLGQEGISSASLAILHSAIERVYVYVCVYTPYTARLSNSLCTMCACACVYINGVSVCVHQRCVRVCASVVRVCTTLVCVCVCGGAKS